MASKASTLAHEECANYSPGSCLGMASNAAHCTPVPYCFLDRGLPCAYFEDCVLPLADKVPRYHGARESYARRLPQTPKEAAKRQELVGILAGHPFCRHGAKWALKETVVVRTCACGAPLEKAKRMCAKCRADKPRNTYREQMRQKRGSGVPQKLPFSLS